MNRTHTEHSAAKALLAPTCSVVPLEIERGRPTVVSSAFAT